MYVAEHRETGGNIFKYNLESRRVDTIYSKGERVRSLVVNGTNLWFIEQFIGLKTIPTDGGEAVNISTTGLSGCAKFYSMYFAMGK